MPVRLPMACRSARSWLRLVTNAMSAPDGYYSRALLWWRVIGALGRRRLGAQHFGQQLQRLAVGRRPEVPGAPELMVLRPVTPARVLQGAARQDVDHARDVFRPLLGQPAQPVVAAEKHRHVHADAVVLERTGQVAHPVGPEAEADQCEPGARVVAVHLANGVVKAIEMGHFAVVSV